MSLRDDLSPTLMTLVRLDGKFERWTIDTDDGVIFDEANNHYYLEEIRAIFFTRQWFGSARENLDQKKILFLRDELEKKLTIAGQIKLPRVIIEWDDVQIETIKHPFKK